MAKARPTSSEIDRFLEEVNRRKQQQARQSAPPPVQRDLPKPKPQQQAPKPVKVQQKQVLVVDEPVVRAVVVEPLVEPAKDYVPKANYPQFITPPTLVRGHESTSVHHAKALLKSKDGLRSVFVLNEILGPPRCKRRFGR